MNKIKKICYGNYVARTMQKKLKHEYPSIQSFSGAIAED